VERIVRQHATRGCHGLSVGYQENILAASRKARSISCRAVKPEVLTRFCGTCSATIPTPWLAGGVAGEHRS